MNDRVQSYIRTIPDFPRPGIQFRDVTSLFVDREGLALVVDLVVKNYQGAAIDKVAAIEARGFVVGGALAYELGLGFVPIRKAGKLPGATIQRSYELEYGQATMEIHQDAIDAGDNVLLVDDLIATGGTALAGLDLVRQLGGVVEHASFIVDLPDLGGAVKVEKQGVSVHSLCSYQGE